MNHGHPTERSGYTLAWARLVPNYY